MIKTRKLLLILIFVAVFVFPSIAITKENVTLLDKLLSSGFAFAIFGSFLMGIVSSLSPCVYPLIPIIVSVIGSQTDGDKLKGVKLSLSFVLGLSLVYSAAGLAAARSGAIIGSFLQSAATVTIVALLFLAMGLSLIGLYEIRIPSFINKRLGAQSQRKGLFSTFAAGCVTGIVAVPCVGPFIVTVSALAAGTTLLKGFALLLAFSLGMGLLFILIGTFTGILTAIPKPGFWMLYLKKLFGLLLIGVSVYYLKFVLSYALLMVVLSAILLSLAFVFSKLKDMGSDSVRIFHKRLSQFLAIGGFVVLMSSQASLFLPDRAPLNERADSAIKWIYDEQQALETARHENVPVLIDFYADWCPGCKELERFTFSDDRVVKRSRQVVFLKVDMTRSNDQNTKLSRKYEVRGLPTVVFLNTEGVEIKELRISGFVTAREMIRRLDKAQDG